MDISSEYKDYLLKAVFGLVVILSLFFIMKLLSEVRSYNMMGGNGMYTITLSGHGEITAVPDIATIYFTISKESKTAKEAQDGVAAIEKKALEFLKLSDVDEKDIKTSNASFYPKSEYVYDTKNVACTEFFCPPRTGKSVVYAYEASESITVKVRNVDDAGKIMQGLGAVGVSNLSGPSFDVDDQDALQMEARKKAIEDARAQAEILAKDLGVRLGRIANFSEGAGYSPMYYAKDMMAVSESASTPAELPKGENTISSDVTITYEIK